MTERWGRYSAGENTYVPGDWYVICDRCGFKVPRSKAKKTWDGLLVCPYDYEERHPQDFIKARMDQQAVPEPRSEGTDVFINDNDVTADSL